MPPLIRVSVLTISDRCSQGLTEDVSGKTLKDLISNHQKLTLSRCTIVGDDKKEIQVQLHMLHAYIYTPLFAFCFSLSVFLQLKLIHLFHLYSVTDF